MSGRTDLTMSAVIIGEYRYELERLWGDNPEKRITFVMLNPSRADASQDDPTIRRCIRFARANGHDALRVVNLFALRTSHPRQLRIHPDPVGPLNDLYLMRAAAQGSVIAAWGALGFAAERARQVHALLVDSGATILCLGLTKAGHPRHPLYLPATAALQEWTPRSAIP